MLGVVVIQSLLASLKNFLNGRWLATRKTLYRSLVYVPFLAFLSAIIIMSFQCGDRASGQFLSTVGVSFLIFLRNPFYPIFLHLRLREAHGGNANGWRNAIARSAPGGEAIAQK